MARKLKWNKQNKFDEYLYGSPGWGRRLITAVVTWWIPSKGHRRVMRAIMHMGPITYGRVRQNEKNQQFPHTLAIVAVMKDEGPYLKEWLDFHILAGVDKFYLYDNGSTDNTMQILEPYIRRGIVDLTPWPYRGRQNDVYVDTFIRHRNDVRWMARLDLDEFIVPVEYDTIPAFLETLPKNFAQLILTWVCYGSAGHKTRPNGMVMENYKYHECTFHGIKSIVNPRLVVRQSNPHQAQVAGPTIDENGKRMGRVNQTNNPPSCEKIRCNHYVTKSLAEFRARCRKGSVAGGIQYIREKEKRFTELDTNDIYDPVMDRWIDKLKKK